MTDVNTAWAVISIMFFVGGLTIGYYAPKYKQSRIRRGDGRWD